MPFKMRGKSPLTKKLVGDQGSLPEKIKKFIRDAPESPAKQLGNIYKGLAKATGLSDYLERNRKAAVERDLKIGYDTKATRALKESRDKAAKERTEKLTGSSTANQNAGQTMKQQMDKVKKFKASERKKTVTTKPSEKTKTSKPKVSVEELKRRKSIQPPPSVQAKGKGTKTVKPPETIKKVSAKPKSDFGKKLTPKQRRKAERNIKAQQKANKRIRKAGGQQIKVDEKNVTATAADRRKLTQGAKQLEKKLSLAQKEIDKKNKKKKEDKKGKGKDTSKGARNIIVPKPNRQM